MTYEEALNYNQKWNETQAFNDLERYLLREEKPAMKAVAIAMKALEKQIPKKPLYDTEWNETHYNYRCPICGGDSYCIMYDNNLEDNYKYCHNCGQALDWSDDE